MRARFIYEKFTEDSDPIKDLGIGSMKYIYDNLKPGDVFRLTKNLPGVKKKKGQFVKIERVIKIEGDIYDNKTIEYTLYNNKEDLKNGKALYKRTWGWSYKFFKNSFEIVSISESLNEKFVQDSDPVQDLRIGIRALIEDWLNKHNIENYVINSDYTIDVNGDVYLNDSIGELPKFISFNETGSFKASCCNLTTLRGFPKKTNGLCAIDHNSLTSLKYAPSIVYVSLFCDSNLLTKESIMEYVNNSKVPNWIWLYIKKGNDDGVRVDEIRKNPKILDNLF